MDRPSTPTTDPDLHAALVAQAPFLRRLARALVRDEHAALDLVQDTWLAALEHPPARPEGLRAWLATTLRRRAVADVRRRQSRARREVAVARPEAQSPEHEASARLTAQQEVLDLVLRLEEPYRTAVYLRYHEDLGPTAMAVRLGVPVKTVKSRLLRAHRRLRERLDALHRDDPRGARGGWVAALLPLALRDANATAGVGGVLFLGLTMQKLLVAAAVLLVALGLLVLRPWRSTAPTAPDGDSAVQPASLPSVPLARSASDPDPARGQVTERAALEPAAPPVGTALLRVRVLWSDGSPAPAVGVQVLADGAGAPREEWTWRTTDADGVALFEGLPPGHLRFASDRAGEAGETTVAAGGTAEETLRLARGLDVQGRVLDPDGLPVPGARIVLTSSRRRWPVGRVVARADQGGSFRLRAVDGEAVLGAAAPGFQRSPEFEVAELTEASRDVRTVDLPLGPRGPRIAGRVVDLAGQGVAHARVVAGPPGGGLIDRPDGTRAQEARPAVVETAADGTFEYPCTLPPGMQPIDAWAPGHACTSKQVLVDGGDLEVELVLGSGARIHGRLVDARGAPVVDGRVFVGHEVGGGWYFPRVPRPEVRTGPDGRFALSLVPAGPVELHGVGPYHGPQGRALAQLAVAEGAAVQVDLALDLGRTIEGRVVDVDGAPLAGWGVYAAPEAVGFEYPRSTSTAADGTFVLANLGEGACTVSVQAPGSYSALPPSKREHVRPGARDLELVVRHREVAASYLIGAVHGADGDVPRDADLTVWLEGTDMGLFAEFDPDDGRFRYGPIESGSYRLKLMRGGRVLASAGPLAVGANETVDAGDLRVAPAGAFEVSLAWPGKAPSRNPYLYLFLESDGLGQVTLAEEDGRYHVESVPEGSWRFYGTGRDVLVEERAVTIRAGETTRLEVPVLAARRVPLLLDSTEDAGDEKRAWTRVRASVLGIDGRTRVPGSWVRRASTESADGAAIEVLAPPGPARIVVETDTGARAERTVDVPPPPEPLGAVRLDLR